MKYSPVFSSRYISHKANVQDDCILGKFLGLAKTYHVLDILPMFLSAFLVLSM